MKSRAYVAAVFAGVAAIAVLVVLVLGPGRFDPSPPSLRAHPVPAIPGEILYVDEDDCIIRARASGESRSEVTCPGTGLSAVSWIDDVTIGYATYGPGTPTWTELNFATGKAVVRERYALPSQVDAVSIKGERIDFDREGSIYRITDGERTKIFDFDGPEYSHPSLVTWSPDGEWLLLRYKDELWIVSRDGSVKGTLAKTRRWSQDASWRIDGRGHLPAIRLQEVNATPPPLPGR